MTKVALLWHMHQPFYQDLVSGEHILPWVRMHALKDYYGMVALLREFPDVRMTFNLVPSLMVQLEEFAEDRARDRTLDLGLKPAAALTDDDKRFVLANFFHAQRARMIEPYPRYAELLRRRDQSNGGAWRQFSDADFRDLQVWSKLVWVDPFFETDPRIVALHAKGSGFTEEDKASLRAVELDVLRSVVPEYRAAAARGQVELAASPFYHPILPLLCDTDVYLRTHPQSRMPRHRFRHPEDARAQLERAAADHERRFGVRPTGLSHVPARKRYQYGRAGRSPSTSTWTACARSGDASALARATMRAKCSSSDTSQTTRTASSGIPPPGTSGSGASRVHSTMPSSVGSPDATPSVNGDRSKRGCVSSGAAWTRSAPDRSRSSGKPSAQAAAVASTRAEWPRKRRRVRTITSVRSAWFAA